MGRGCQDARPPLTRTTRAFLIAITTLMGCANKPPESTIVEGIPPNLFRKCEVALPPPTPIGALDWNTDVAYDLSERPGDVVVTNKQIRISGDSLIVDAEHFGSILKSTNQAITNFDEILFDARRIVIRGPMSFTTARVRILAKEVIFEERGAIALTDAPRNANDGLEIVARSLEIKKGLKRRFLFKTSGGSAQKISVTATDLHMEGDSTAFDSSSAALALWRLSLDYPKRNQSVPDAQFSVLVGEEAEKRYLSTFSDRMVWPWYFSAKVKKWFSRSPYDPALNATLKATILGSEADLKQWSSLQPYATLEKVLKLIDDKLDADGNSLEFVPRVGLQYQVDSLRMRLKDSENYLAALRGLVLAANEGRVVNADELKRVREQTQVANKDMESIVSGMGSLLTVAQELEQNIQGILVGIDQRRVALRRVAEDLKKRSEDAYRVAVGAKVLALAACALPVAAPVAIGISTGIGLVGDQVYKHNTSGGAGPGNAIQSFESIKARSDAYYKQVGDAKVKWDDVQKNWGEVKKAFNSDATEDLKKKRIEAAQDLKNSLVGFAQAAANLNKEIEAIPRPTEIDMNKLEAEDVDLTRLLSEVTRLRSLQSETNAKILSNQQTLSTLREDFLKQKALEQDLLAATPRNDVDFARWKGISLSLWQSYFSAMYRDAVILRRAYFFETGQYPSVDADALYFPDETLSYMATGIYNASGPSQGSVAVRDHLLREEAKMTAGLGGLLDAVEGGLRDHLSKRTSRDFVQHVFTFSGTSRNQSQSKFLDTLNLQIADQVNRDYAVEKAPANKGLPGPFPLYVPVEIPPAISPFPERYVGAQISRIRFVNPGSTTGKSFRFIVQHAGFGAMVRNGVCYRYDLRQANAENRIFRTTLIKNTQIVGGRESEVESIFLDPMGLRYYTLYPGRAPYFLSVQVDGDRSDAAWSQVPRIKELELTLELMQ